MKAITTTSDRSYLSINIVHTDLYNYRLFDNEVLLSQLAEIHKSLPLTINILCNGSDLSTIVDRLGIKGEFIEYSIKKIFDDLLIFRYKNSVDNEIQIIKSNKIYPLGKSRDILASITNTTYYINADEDDNFISIGAVEELLSLVPKLTRPLTAYGFKWIYGKYKDDQLWIMSKNNPVITQELNRGVLEKSLQDLRGLCSWNFIFRTDYFRTIPRPCINGYDDTVFYSNLTRVCPVVDYAPIIVYEYHGERGTMSTQKNDVMNIITDYITQTSFKLGDIITPDKDSRINQ